MVGPAYGRSLENPSNTRVRLGRNAGIRRKIQPTVKVAERGALRQKMSFFLSCHSFAGTGTGLRGIHPDAR